MQKFVAYIACATAALGLVACHLSEAPTPAHAEPITSQAIAGFPSFNFDSVVLDPVTLTFNPTGEIIFPSIIRAADYFNSPLATYYMYYAPHDAPGSISLAYANSLDGPWTEYANNPVIANNWQPHYNVSHVSSPHAIWMSGENKMFLYFHGENNRTRYASTTDGVTFNYEGIAVRSTDFSGISESSYARVFEYTIPTKNNTYILTA
jgi:hypothetical protein